MNRDRSRRPEGETVKMRILCLLICCCPALLAAGHNILLPQPQRVQYGEGRLALHELSITITESPAPEDSFAARTLSEGLARLGIATLSGSGAHRLRLIRSGPADALPRDNEQTGLDSRESYHLHITPAGGEVRAPSSAGLFYAVQTLLQLVEGSGKNAAVPAVEIDDWPSLAYRGVMYDLSHGPLPTEDEIKRQIDFLSRWKANQYYFYSELSIELKGYPLINPGGRYSQDQVRRIVAYGRERHVDIVPCLEFFGHLHDLFRIERYADLSALPHGGDLNPRNPDMQRMLDDWVGQMTALFPSPWFHIGLDEPWELERAGNAGGIEPGKLYLDHLNHMTELVRRRGKRVLFWADVASGANLFEKYPQLASGLPEGTLPVPWHYHDEKDYSRMLDPFSRAKVPQVIGTGIWGWDTIVPDFRLTFANIDGFLRDGRKHGTLGVINTNWADDAQLLYRMTQPGVAYGAIAAWQPGAVDREHFFANYGAAVYGEMGGRVAAALAALDAAQQAMTAAVGAEDMFRLWDDPLAPQSLARTRTHVQDLRTTRLKAEEAQEHLQAALAADPESLASLLLGARLLDYAGLKFLYAAEISDIFATLATSSPSRADLSFWLGRQMGDRNHSRAADLMDLITELRDLYRAAWQAQYTDYRLGAALGRFDAEYEYWRRFQARLWEVRRTYREGSPAPTLDSLRR